MTRLLLRRLYGAEHRPPDRVPGFVLPQVERRVEIERFLEFVPALRDSVGSAVNEGEVLVRPDAIRSAAQTRVEARLEQLRRVGDLAILVGSHSELQLLLALVRAEQGAPGRGCE